ncbi:hypothetical protein HZC53_02360 [Candidatus Uhrbacteria bacterium]|nr:hypothetical protein [Candidatus Uhrbacteria bacterium]
MNRAVSRLLVGGLFCFLSFQFAATASALCCKCYAPGDSTDICLSGDAANCADMLKNSKNPSVANFNCVSEIKEAASCRTVAAGGICTQASSVLNYTLPAATPAPSTQPPLATPNPGVEIPGLAFSSSPQVNKGVISIPFLAQYISAMYNYLIGVALIVSAVMLVYGGFRYVLGSTVGDIRTGKEIVFNSLVGLGLVLGAFTLLRMVSPPAATLKPLEVMVVKRDPMDDWFSANGTTYPDSPTNFPPSESPPVVSDGESPEQTVPLAAGDRVDVSGISYDSSLTSCKNIMKFCYTPEAKSADTFEKKQKVLAKAVLGFNKVCIQNGRCVYSQAVQSSMGDCSLPNAKSKAFYSVPRLNAIGLSVEQIWPSNPECVEAWKQKGGPSKVNEMTVCNGIARDLYNERINKKIEEAGVFAADCGGFVSSIFNCSNVKRKMWTNDLTRAVNALAQKKSPPANFMQTPQLVVFTNIGDPELDAKIAQKGGLKFGDVIFVSGGSGQNAMHFYLYTGGRSDVPFTFIEMGGSGPGANIPGVGVIKGANTKNISFKQDLQNKTTTRKEYAYWCAQSSAPYSGRKKNCKESEMVTIKASYNTDGALMVWRPLAE